MTELSQAFWDALDEVPRSHNAVLVPGPRGEFRSVPISAAASEFRVRTQREETMKKRERAAADAVAVDTETAVKAAGLALDAAGRAENAPRKQNERARAEGIERARLELASEEGSWLGRLSPRRNPWPELTALDERIAELDGEQATALADVQALEQEIREAEERDRVALGQWHADGGSGERPQPSAPAVAERLERRREDSSALPNAAATAVAEKIAFVRRHRGRLVRRADERVQELAEQYIGLIAALEACRGDLLAAREAALWARLYPSASAMREPPQALALGLRKPAMEAFGHPLRLEPARLWDLLRRDAELIPNAIADEQKRELDGPDPHDPRSAVWAESAEGQERDRAERQAAIERLQGMRG